MSEIINLIIHRILQRSILVALNSLEKRIFIQLMLANNVFFMDERVYRFCKNFINNID